MTSNTNSGQVVALTGRTGAGKSSLLLALLGLLEQDCVSGDVSISGELVDNHRVIMQRVKGSLLRQRYKKFHNDLSNQNLNHDSRTVGKALVESNEFEGSDTIYQQSLYSSTGDAGKFYINNSDKNGPGPESEMCSSSRNFGALISIIPQKPLVFTSTLRGNLDPSAVGKQGHFSDSELISAFRTVGWTNLLVKTTDLKSTTIDMDSLISPNTLSHVEKQQICAARLLLSRPRVALLDEILGGESESDDVNDATLNLGSKSSKNHNAFAESEGSERLLENLLRELRQMRSTVLLVTHQPEVVEKYCDREIKLKAGIVVEERLVARAAGI